MSVAKTERPRKRKSSRLYKRVLLSYADLLGFRTSLRKRSARDIRQALSTFREGTEPESTFADRYEVSYFNFSDLVVRTTPIDSTANTERAIGLLYHELHDLAFAQAVMASLGFLVRGAVTVGLVYSEQNMIFGEALVRAYELESTVALYPRIIIDPQVLQLFEQTRLLKNDIHDHDSERPYIRDLLLTGPDGVYFIDYLGATIREDLDNAAAIVESHRSLICESAADMKVLDSSSAKLGWLAEYHNSVARRYTHDSDLLVNVDKVPALFRLPAERISCPLSDELVEALFDFVVEMVQKRGCDNSMRFTERWLAKNQQERLPVMEWLGGNGAGVRLRSAL